jgi:hypothetical protein
LDKRWTTVLSNLNPTKSTSYGTLGKRTTKKGHLDKGCLALFVHQNHQKTMSSPREQAIILLEEDFATRKKAAMAKIQAHPNQRAALLREHKNVKCAIDVLKTMTDSHWNDYLKRK